MSNYNSSQTQESSPAKPPLRCSSVDEVMAFEEPGPISELYTDPTTGLTFRIEGFKSKFEKIDAVDSAYELFDAVKKGETTFRDRSGNVIKAPMEYIAMAVFASRCVAEPKLSEAGWLSTLDRSDILERVFVRILICNRDLTVDMLSDDAEKTVAEAK